MNPVEMLRASGLNPVVIDEDTDIDSALSELLGETDTPERRETNTEFVTRLMEYCPHGPMGQAFVMEALAHYCAAIEDAKPEDCENSFMAPGLWKQLGAWLQGELDARYGKD